MHCPHVAWVLEATGDTWSGQEPNNPSRGKRHVKKATILVHCSGRKSAHLLNSWLALWRHIMQKHASILKVQMPLGC